MTLINYSFDEYDADSAQTDVGDRAQKALGHDWLYYLLGIMGEAGELSEKVKKLYRDHDGVMSDEYRLSILYELGDILWYVTRLSSKLDSSIAEVALLNRHKLFSRKKRKVLHGEGDNR